MAALTKGNTPQHHVLHHPSHTYLPNTIPQQAYLPTQSGTSPFVVPEKSLLKEGSLPLSNRQEFLTPDQVPNLYPQTNEEDGEETMVDTQYKAQRLARKLDSDIDEPLENDVLLGRGAHAFHHEGNKRWKKLTMAQSHKYYTSKRHEKRKIAECIVQQVHGRMGRFLKKETTGKYDEIDDKEATLKTSQLFRDFRSSKKVS